MYTQRSRNRSRTAVLVAAAVVALLVGLWLGGHPSWLPGPVRSAFVSQSSEQQLTNDVYGLLQSDYYRPVTRSTLVNQGLAAAVASLGDPYSHYFDPADYHAFQNQSNPHLSGVGIDAVSDPRGLRVVDVFPGSPAARAGLGHGDLIVSVGSTSLVNRPEGFSAALIKGRAGTRVTLTVRSGARRRTVTLTRADLTVPVASGNVVTSHGHKLGIVQLTSFTPGSGDELRAQVDKVLHAGARGLVLDLRENGGGLLEEGVNVASIFIPDGTIVSTAGRSQPRQVYMAKGGAISTKIPLVVLVDRGTASAAEIVTGALQDRHRRARRRHPHLRQGRLPGDPAAAQRRRAGHHGRRVLHPQRHATSGAAACGAAPGSPRRYAPTRTPGPRATSALQVALSARSRRSWARAGDRRRP